MIAFLSGKVKSVGNESLILDVNGVGYEVAGGGWLGKLKVGEELDVHTYHYIREDASKLFGFPERRDFLIFQLLLGVSGIGPKIALAMVDELDVDTILDAIWKENAAVLTGVSGVGKKVADRVILELSGKLEESELGISKGSVSGGTSKVSKEAQERLGEVKEALKSLGYKVREIDVALNALAREMKGDEDVQSLMKKALVVLSK